MYIKKKIYKTGYKRLLLLIKQNMKEKVYIYKKRDQNLLIGFLLFVNKK